MTTNISKIVICILIASFTQQGVTFAGTKGIDGDKLEVKKPPCLTIQCCMIDIFNLVSFGEQYFSVTICCCSRAGFVNLSFDNEEINRLEGGVFKVKQDIVSPDTETPFIIKMGEYEFSNNNLIIPITVIE